MLGVGITQKQNKTKPAWRRYKRKWQGEGTQQHHVSMSKSSLAPIHCFAVYPTPHWHPEPSEALVPGKKAEEGSWYSFVLKRSSFYCLEMPPPQSPSHNLGPAGQ